MTVEYKVVNPATGETESTHPTATDAEIGEAIARTQGAFAGWSRTPVEERARLIHRVADLYAERIDELAALITREMGKTTAEATGEIEFVVDIYRYYADNGARLLADEPLPSETGGNAIVRKTPIGPLLGIMPWNYPYYQVARFAGPNLLAGNTILLKHAPQCPESALAMEQLFADAGVPADAYVNIFATNEQVADIIGDSRVRGVSVTGSERAGTAVASLAGQHLKKVVLELGGSDPYLILDTDDLPTRRRGLGRRPHGERRAGVQRRQALPGGRPPLRRVRRAVHRGDGGADHRRPVRPEDVLRTAVVRSSGRRPARPGAGRHRQGRHGAHRRAASRPARARSSRPPSSPT